MDIFEGAPSGLIRRHRDEVVLRLDADEWRVLVEICRSAGFEIEVTGPSERRRLRA